MRGLSPCYVISPLFLQFSAAQGKSGWLGLEVRWSPFLPDRDCVLPALYPFSCTALSDVQLPREMYSRWCSLSVVSAKAIRNQIVRMNWGDETDTKQPWLLYKHGLSACSATCECQTKQLPRSLLLGELEATTWTSSYYVDEDLKFNNLSLNQAIDVAQNLHSGDWCLHLVLRTPSGVYQKKKKKEADIVHLFAVICIIFKNATSRHHCCCVKYSPLHVPQSFWSAATLNLAVLTVCILCHNKLLNLL